MRRTDETIVPRRAVGEVTFTTIADLPIGVAVTMWTLGPGSHLERGPSDDDAQWVVWSGKGWVDSSESGRQKLERGVAVYVPVEDTPTFGSGQGMTIVEVFGGLMMPR